MSIADDDDIRLKETADELKAVFLTIGKLGENRLCSVACAANVLGAINAGKR